MIQFNNFNGLRETEVANEFITKVIALVKNISTTFREQKGNITTHTDKVFQLACALLRNNLVCYTISPDHV